jgi:hypothetical protein
MSLTLSSKSSPFPFSVIAIAAYTGKAAVVFDEAASGITLELDEKTYHDEHDIVQIIGRASNLREDPSRVCVDSMMTPRFIQYVCPDTRIFHSRQNRKNCDASF